MQDQINKRFVNKIGIICCNSDDCTCSIDSIFILYNYKTRLIGNEHASGFSFSLLGVPFRRQIRVVITHKPIYAMLAYLYLIFI